MAFFQVTIENAKRQSEAMQASNKEKFATTLANLQGVQMKLKFGNVELQSKLSASQEEVASLNASVLGLG